MTFIEKYRTTKHIKLHNFVGIHTGLHRIQYERLNETFTIWANITLEFIPYRNNH